MRTGCRGATSFIMTHRVAACPLLIVVDKHVVPGEGAHVGCIQGAEEPHHS
jgi:hypothetical protein